MYRAQTVLAIGILFLLVAGCSGDADGDSNGGSDRDTGTVTDIGGDTSDATDSVGDTSAPDSDDASDVGTECVDCADSVTCQDGLVTWSKGGGGCFPANDVPECSELSSGLSESHQCDDGCRTDEDYSDVFDPSTVELGCEENRPKSAGEDCETDTDCTPSEHSEPELTCDPDTMTCVMTS